MKKWSMSSPAAAAASSLSFFSIFSFFVLLALSSGDERAGKCSLEVDEGTCSSQILRWFFNRKTQHCETFVYSGCGGNANNFNSTMYCLHACNGTASNTHSYSAISPSSSSSNSNNAKENSSSSGRKVAKRSRGSQLRSKRSDDVTGRVAKQRASPGDEGESLSSALTQLTHSVNRLESLVHQNSRRISKLGSKGRKTHLRSTLAPDEHHQDAAGQQMGEKEGVTETSNGKGIRKERASHSPSSSSSSSEGEGDEDERQRDLLDSKLRGIISDPSFVFSCRNISSSDLSTLKEAVLEFDTEALREVTSSSSSAAASDEAGRALPPTKPASGSNSVRMNPVAEKKKKQTNDERP